MVGASLDKEILEQVERLNQEQKRQVLAFARDLAESSRLRGTPAEEFFASAAEAKFDAASLQEMQQAIEEDCERIDLDGWQ